MITINSLKEMKKYYDEQLNTFVFDDVVEFTINIDVESNIEARDINARDINARDIKACNIKACNIKANDIEAYNISALDINACNIKAFDINALNIKAFDINADDINACNIDAWNIYYYYFCIAYYSFKCKSVSSDRVNSICKCLDKEIEYIK